MPDPKKRLRVATFIVEKRSFEPLQLRLLFLQECVRVAARYDCNLAVLPGGFFKLPQKRAQALESRLLNKTGPSTLPLVVGVDLTFSACQPHTTLGKHSVKKRQPTNTDSEPWVWVVLRSQIRKFKESWQAPYRFDISEHACQAVQVNDFAILPLACGDIFVKEIRCSKKAVDLIVDTAHWSVKSGRWSKAILDTIRCNSAPFVMAQHLARPPGCNNAFNRNGQRIDATVEGDCVALHKLVALTAAYRVYDFQ